MRQEKTLDRIFGQKTKVKILRYLVLNPGEYTGRSLARLAGVNHWQCNKTLKELYQEHVLLVKKAGGSYLYALDTEKYIVEKMIMPLFKGESEIAREITLGFRNMKGIKPASLILFGSSARRQDKPGSDIDLAVVVGSRKDKKTTEKDLFSAENRVYKRFGAVVSPYIITEEEFRDRFLKKDSLINNIVSEGVVVYGKTMGEIITLR
jgi:predicted nucleotidyltransferase